MKKTVIILFLISSLLSPTLSAFELKKEDILEKSYLIQIGAFKKSSSVDRVKQKLLEFDIFVEDYKNFQRIYIVNILTKNELKETLKKIRKYYPDAFVAKRPKLTFFKKMVEPASEQPIKVKQSLESIKDNKIETYKYILDSNSILKTRKSFL